MALESGAQLVRVRRRVGGDLRGVGRGGGEVFGGELYVSLEYGC